MKGYNIAKGENRIRLPEINATTLEHMMAGVVVLCCRLVLALVCLIFEYVFPEEWVEESTKFTGDQHEVENPEDKMKENDP